MNSRARLKLRLWCICLDKGLALQGVAGLLQPHALLLVLLQSQRVDGEKRHVGLSEREKTFLSNTSKMGKVHL